MLTYSVYLLAFLVALMGSLAMTPLVRLLALKLDILDRPSTQVKTHKEPVPYLGGVAIFWAFIVALLVIRFATSFPSGTLRSLRGVILGSGLIFLMGLIDDVKHGGLHYGTKFLIQISAAVLVMMFGIRIKFVDPSWVATLLTIVWLVGITNAFNIIDIMDGLSSGIGVFALLAFLFISLPTEEIYVNIAAVALSGAILGFIPFNLSKSKRIFMGDCGSLLIGFIAGSISLGTSYGNVTQWGVLAPILILGVPILDTLLVSVMRIRRGISPFMGSKDHFPLRLEMLGWSRNQILVFCWGLTLFFSLGAYFLLGSSIDRAMVVFIVYGIFIAFFVRYVLKVHVT